MAKRRSSNPDNLPTITDSEKLGSPSTLFSLLGPGKITNTHIEHDGTKVMRILGQDENDIKYIKAISVPRINTQGSDRKVALDRMEKEGFSRREMAEMFGISESRVSQIMNERRK